MNKKFYMFWIKESKTSYLSGSLGFNSGWVHLKEFADSYDKISLDFWFHSMKLFTYKQVI